MANESEMVSNKKEWRVNMPENSLESMVKEFGITKQIYKQLQAQILECLMKMRRFIGKARDVASSEPRKVVHGVKVGMALSLVSLFYYMRPLYDGVGGNAMWAVMTVVVAFEYSVGATIAKSFNRLTATFLAGSIGLCVHWVANQCGEELEPLILQASVVVLAAAATFSRFIPTIKARFDYGAMIFILTFCFVSVSSYRVDKILKLATNRVSTIAIGTSICILTSMLLYPVWAGKQLHNLIYHNLQKLADSLDGCVKEYFKDSEESSSGKQEGYKCVLNSKAAEESMANLARWEPAHGRFKFGHPWKQYLKIGASMRSCAYCIETLSGFIDSEVEAPELLKKHLKQVCTTLSSCSSNVLRELATTMKTMTKSTKTEVFVQEMKFAVQDFQNAFQGLLNNRGEKDIVRIMEVFPVATIASVLIEIAGRIEGVVVDVDELASQAEFDMKHKRQKPSKFDQDQVTITNFQKV